MKNSQFKVEQVTTLDNAPENGNGNTTTPTTTTTTTTTADSKPDIDPVVDDKTTTTDTDSTADTPNKTDNKPVIFFMNTPSDSKSKKEGIDTASNVVYFGVMGAIIIALLAVAYNSVKTASVPKVK